MAAVLIIMAVLFSLIVVSGFLSIGESRSGLDLFLSERTLFLAEGCAEDALLFSRNDETYAGGDIVHPEGTCSVEVEKDGTVWTMTVSAVRDGFSRTMEVVFNRDILGVTLIHWQERP